MNDIQTKRPIPEYVRKCFTSKIKAKIERCLARAYAEGFTKEEISEEFHKVFRNKKEVSHVK